MTMAGQIDAKLAEMGVTLPVPGAPLASYVPWVRSGNLVFVSGQVSVVDGEFIKGRLGDTMTAEEGAKAAKVCAINLLAQVKSACDGDLDRLRRVVKLTGFVNSTQEAGEHPVVINGASNFFLEVLGDKGKHARSAFGAILPFGVAVEIEGIFEVE
jgi:enamine deaminase RidA (YjgF/YER057c/UK114 family)